MFHVLSIGTFCVPQQPVKRGTRTGRYDTVVAGFAGWSVLLKTGEQFITITAMQTMYSTGKLS